MYPCRVEERLAIELVEGREVERIVTTVTKNEVVTRYPRKFHEYQLTDKEKEIERMMIYWEQVEYEVSDDDDSALKSTARSVPKDYELGDTGMWPKEYDGKGGILKVEVLLASSFLLKKAKTCGNTQNTSKRPVAAMADPD
ncbi:hypothetical protein Tco_0851081 [Tanacetum coccineum]